MIKIYRKKTTIKAEQFDGSQKMIRKYAHPVPKNVPEPSSNSWVTKNGLFEFHIGDWFISKPDGIYGPITNTDFERDNAELPAIPKFVADWIENCRQLDSGDIATVLLSNDDEQPQGKFADYTTTYVIYNANTVARAYLDGYQVEDDK